ncbi:hypothetical protein PRIPAC_80175, partial [Pristionchus pacificus]|uniref:G protein-coupled receptor n=1 Tax=Pristionchus pacificus TaxID=54126 RepID=A0A2A6C303_PRIPA
NNEQFYRRPQPDRDGLGIVLSSVLVLCIVVKTPRDVGNFKYLQLLFVLTDVAYSCAAYILDEIAVLFLCTQLNSINAFIQKVITHEYKFCLITLSADNLFCVCIYCTFFCAIILIVAVNFLYRLWARDGHYNLIPLLGFTIFAGIIASVIMFMGYASFSIVQYLRHSKIMSEKSRKLQIALFRMLACQTAVPVVLVHGCAGAQLFVPLIGINIELYSDISTVFLSFFTPIDALVVILLIKNYRDSVFFCCRCSSKFGMLGN